MTDDDKKDPDKVWVANWKPGSAPGPAKRKGLSERDKIIIGVCVGVGGGLAIALGVGLGVGLKKRREKHGGQSGHSGHSMLRGGQPGQHGQHSQPGGQKVNARSQAAR